MRVKDVMTRKVLSVLPQASVGEALDAMVRSHLSGLPVVDDAGRLVGVVSEGDFLRRGEIGTQASRRSWLQEFLLPGRAAEAYSRAYGRRVHEIMSADVVTIGENAGLEEAVELMEKRKVKRLPVVAGDKLVGIITRGDFVRTLSLYVRQPYEEEMASDAEIKRDIEGELRAQKWAPIASIEVSVRNGVVNLFGFVTDDRERNGIRVIAENVAGVLQVHDHMTWIGTYPGVVMLSPEDDAKGRAA